MIVRLSRRKGPTEGLRARVTAPRSATVLAHVWTSFTDDEVAAWLEIEAVLKRRGGRLLLSVPASATPPADFPISIVRFPTWLDLTPVAALSADSQEAGALGVDLDAVVAAERCWDPRSPAEADGLESRWRRAAINLAGFYHTLCATVRPAAALVWNGWHGAEIVLRGVLNQWRCPVWFAERGPFPGTLFVDRDGISADSSFVRRQLVVPRSARGSAARAIFRQISEAHDPAVHTWWTQPAPRFAREALRERLGVPAEALVVLFAAQVDEDTQAFRFSPLFRRNLDALKWLVGQLPRDGSVFLLGKHHPRSTRPPAEFAEVVGSIGRWTTDLALADALSAADRVAAVNSSVLFEAALSGLPVLTLGRSLATGRECFHEVTALGSGPRVVRRWLLAQGDARMRRRFLDLGASLIAHRLFALHSRMRELGVPSAADLANRISRGIRQRVTRSVEPAVLERERWLIAHWNRSFEAIASSSLAPMKRPLDPREARLLADLWRAAAESAHRPVWIWGAGTGGRNLYAALNEIGGRVAGFLDSDPHKATKRVMDLPVAHPEWLYALAPGERPFVTVASVFSAQITAALDQAGWNEGCDYLVIDVEWLTRRHGSVGGG